MAECSVFHEFFYYAWCVFDVPNWLTLVVEVGVAGFLGFLFYKLSNRYYVEMKKGKKEKRATAIRTIDYFTNSLYDNILLLRIRIKEIEKNQIGNRLDKVDWDRWENNTKPILNEILEVVKIYADNLEAKELEYIQGLVSAIQTVPHADIPYVEKYLLELDKIFTYIESFTKSKLLKEKLSIGKNN